MGRSCIILSEFSSSTILSNQSVEIPASSGALVKSRAGDILMLPVVLAAFWTIACQFVLIAVAGQEHCLVLLCFCCFWLDFHGSAVEED